MFRFALNLVSKVGPSKNGIGGLNWRRGYADKSSLNPDFLHFHGHECFLPGVGTSSFQQVENFTCDMHENGFRYRPVMYEALRYGILKALEGGLDGFTIICTILPAIRAVKAHLKCRAQIINASEQFTQVAITAANGDTETGQLVGRAFEKVLTGLYIVSNSLSNDVLEFYNAIVLYWKPLSPFFMGGNETSILENPIILIHENKITSKNVVLQAIGLTSDRQPLLIITEGLAEIVTILLLAVNQRKTKVNVCVVKAPDVQNKKGIMQDIAIFTGCQVLTSVCEINFKPTMLGSCKKVMVETNKLVFLGGSGSQEEIEKRCEQLIATLDNGEEVESSKDRLHQLSRTAAVIKADCSSEQRISNIIDAVVSAHENGILPGAGVALLHACKELDKFQTKNPGEKIAMQIFQNVLKVPVYSMASAVGCDGSFVVKKLLDQDNPNLGYNPVTGDYEDVIKSGIVDPLEFVLKELTDMQRYIFKVYKTCQRELRGGALK